ncbi:MAG: response regulator [Spirochaetes bacterium]|nr:response regulator [Spirochaetota bacterium]
MVTMTKNIKILIIDDEDIIRQQVSSFLRLFNYNIIEASGGNMGLKLYEKEKPDIVLTDLRMPDVDGLEILKKISTENPDIPVIIVSGTGDMNDAINSLRLGAWDYIIKPIYDLAVLDYAIKKVIERSRLIRENKEYQHQLERMVEERTKKMQAALDGALLVIVASVEIRDPYTAGHQRKVAGLAKAIGELMNLDENLISGLYRAAMIHDVGKLAIPSEILAKPAKLTRAELELIKEHSEAGYNILKNIEFPWPIAEIVKQHHETIDGAGYPYGLKGSSIMIEAKILTVADIVEAIASHRPYRAAIGLEYALNYIEEQSGISLDPDVVAACLELFREKNYQFEDESVSE